MWRASNVRLGGLPLGRLSVVAAGFLAFACGGDGSTGPETNNTSVVTSVSVTPASATVDVGGTYQFAAQALDQNGTPFSACSMGWSSNNANVATVDDSGLVTGVGVGQVDIVATCGGKSGTGTVTVVATDMTFVAHLPGNTPPGDAITFYYYGDSLIGETMTRMAGDSAVLTLPVSSFGPDGTLNYRYSRNASNYVGSEYLLPDNNDYFFAELGRHTTFQGAGVQEDTVARWRWFPEGEITPPEPVIDPPTVFMPRLTGTPFLPGAYLQDLYEPWFDGLFQPTAQYLSQKGYGMAALAPPWHVLSTDPPLFGTDPSKPDYPDSSLRAQISALVDAGLEVVVQPQLDGLPDLSTEESATWWDQWFQQESAFLVYHAQIAQEAGAEWFAFYPDAQHATVPPSDLDARFRALVAEIRGVYSGKVGVNFMEFSNAAGTDLLIPDTTGFTWLDAVDFVTLSAAGAMVSGSAATTDQLVQGGERILGPVQAVAEAQGIPVLLLPAYASVAESWRGTSFYGVYGVGVAAYGGEDEWQEGGTFSFSQQDQAKVLDAWYRVAAETPVVQSVLPFGYWNMDMPLVPDYSIRGKTAEGVVEAWR